MARTIYINKRIYVWPSEGFLRRSTHAMGPLVALPGPARVQLLRLYCSKQLLSSAAVGAGLLAALAVVGGFVGLGAGGG